MFHGKPLNQSTNTSQQQPQWPLNPQDYNNLRQSQNLSSKNIPVKFYLPDGEIRRSTIDTACNYQRITSFVKQYASVADKEVLLAWFDDQSEWIRFDTESEFTDAMNFARSLLNVPNSVFKIQAKVKKDVVLKKKQKPVTTVITQEPVPTTQPIQPVPQQPIRPTQPVLQHTQPQLQPQPVPQKPINQPMQPQMQPQIQPQQPINHPYYNPVQPVQSPFQPQFQPMAMNQPPMSMNQPSMVMNQPMPSLRGSPYTTPTKTLNSSVTMQQPHPLNSSFSSSQPTVQQQQQQQQPQQPQQQQQQQQQPTVQQQQPVATNDNNGAFDPTHISFLRDIGFGFDDAVLIKVLKEANGDVSVAAEKLLSYKQ